MMSEMPGGFRPPAAAIFITGFMGTGKSVVGRALAGRLGLQWVDTDEIVQARAALPITEIFARHGEEHFRELETAALREALAGPPRVISTGGGVLLREENRALMGQAGPVVCLTASADEILRRVGADDTRPLLRRPDPKAAIERLLAERASCYAAADCQVDTTGLSVDEVAERVQEVLAGDPRAVYFAGRPLVVPVSVPGAEYQVSIGLGLLGMLGELVPPRQRGVRAALVSSEPIAALYADTVLEALSAAGWDVTQVTVPDGEAAKSLEVYGSVCEQMAAAGLDRGGCVFALGGGVVGDLAGFAAATYMRGVVLVHLPTSLLAQVDSSIGGKTAVDLGAGKNLVGAFHQPRAVVADVSTLQTLPPPELRSGLGEVIKHACCFDAQMFGFLGTDRDRVLGIDVSATAYLVARNCQIKAGVVEQDPTEQGLRAVLNYGHTVGHALERAAGEWELRHGEVVGIGMVAESRVAAWLGRSDEETSRRQEELIAAYGLPTRAQGVDPDRARQALRRDKKIVAGRLRMPLVSEIGSFEIVEDVPLEMVERGLDSVLA